jgi:UDP-3-O-[3-hydroxymyristoyl] N-acetylglucosamine deacetylase
MSDLRVLRRDLIFILGIKNRHHAMQQTLNQPIDINGIGLHSGKTVSLRLVPAPADHGIVFKRTDMEEGTNLIPATYDRVVDTRLCTLIANDHGARVGTIEHLMAALRGCGIDNVLVELDAAEVPVMDGSSKPFVDAIDAVGVKTQSKPRRAIKILKTVTVRDGDKIVTLSPSTVPVFKGRIVFHHADIGTQDYTLKLVNGNFRHDVADCRTFGFAKEAEMLRAAGLGLGGSLENAIILGDHGVMNPDGLRCTDEFIRHKILDAVGDLYLAGGPIIGAYDGFKAGHALNNAILHALFADDTAWMPVDLHADIDDSETVLLTAVAAPANASRAH